MRDGAGRAGRVAAACLALAAVSLLLPWALAFDPWAWLVWGREVGRLELDTAGGPSWKPLPVVATTVLALADGAAPALWLVLARAGGLLALAGAAALAGRLAGPVAAVAAAAAMALSDWWLFNTALGNSEGLLAAAVLWAAVAHLAGRHRAALALLLCAALLRPEAWPFLGGYALWLWRSGREPLPLLIAALLPVPLLWFGPDILGAGGALGASDAARGTASPQSAVNADVPALEVLLDFAELLTLPVLLAAVAGTALGGAIERRLAAAALAWVALVALMTQAGYAGNPRYNVAAAAVGCVLAGVGRGAAPRLGGATAGRRAGRRSRVRSRSPSLPRFWPSPRTTSPTRSRSSATVPTGGPSSTRSSSARAPPRSCAPARTDQPMKAMLAWRLDQSMELLAERPRPPAAVFQPRPATRASRPNPRSPAASTSSQRRATGRSPRPASSHLRLLEADRDLLEAEAAHHALEHRARVALGASRAAPDRWRPPPCSFSSAST